MQFHREWVLFSKKWTACSRSPQMCFSRVLAIASYCSLSIDYSRFALFYSFFFFILFPLWFGVVWVCFFRFANASSHCALCTCVCVWESHVFVYIYSACSLNSYLWCSHLLPKLSFISFCALVCLLLFQ